MPVAAFGGGVHPLERIRRIQAPGRPVGDEAQTPHVEHRMDHSARGAGIRIEHDHRAARIGSGEKLRFGDDVGDDASGRWKREGGRKVQEGGDIGIPLANSC